ncbi:MAG: FixH family protein [Nitrospirota bacterium]|jgi:hypothetical protein
MRRPVFVVFLFLLAGPAFASPGVTKHYEASRLQMGQNGVFSVELLVPEGGLAMGLNSVDVIVHDREDRDIAGAEVTVTPWMPEMGHGVHARPTVMERGGGLYTVSDLMLTMTGHWELRIGVKMGEREDQVVFDFPHVGAGEEGVEGTAPAEKLDLSRSVLSEEKVFRVSYTPSPDPPPVGRIHGWTLTVTSPEGEPVTGAKITVVGDMPEHGHGLPTEPEVTGELGEGRYLVEGMKFSMPGWWVVSFGIEAGERADSARFNLMVR